MVLHRKITKWRGRFDISAEEAEGDKTNIISCFAAFYFWANDAL